MALDYGYTIRIQSNGTSDPAHTPTNQWQRKLSGQSDFVDLTGETGTTYTVNDSDQSSSIRLKQGFGSAFAYSNILTVTSSAPAVYWKRLTSSGICGREISPSSTYCALVSCVDYLAFCYGNGEAAEFQKIWYSNNGGKTWSGKLTSVTDGVCGLASDKLGNIVYKNNSTSNKQLYYGTLFSQQRSSNIPRDVAKTYVPLSGAGSWAICAASNQGPWTSRDGGNTWAEADDKTKGYAENGHTNEHGVTALMGSSSQNYVTTTSDNGANWTIRPISSSVKGSKPPLTYHAPSGNWILINSTSKVIWRSTDLTNWHSAITYTEPVSSSNKILASSLEILLLLTPSKTISIAVLPIIKVYNLLF